MRENKYFEEFGKPFDASDVSWRLQYVDKAKCEGFAVPYLDARAIAERLDSVVGQNHWKDSYTPWHNCTVEGKQRQSQLCTIYIYDEELKEWIGKTDGAEDSNIEPVKGGLSDAFKRAAVKWNIGRYLYGFEPVWVKAKQRGDSYVIDKSEDTKLESSYNSTVASMFGAGNNQSEQKNGQQPTQHQEDNVITMPQAHETSPKPQNINNNTSQPIYEVVKVVSDEKGELSKVLLGCGDKKYQTYMNSKDNSLKAGTKITNIKTRKGSNAFTEYTILNSYDIAA